MTTQSRIEKVEINMAEIKTDIRYIKKDITEVKADIKDFIKCADDKYASKSIETYFYWFIGIIVAAAITGVVAL